MGKEHPRSFDVDAKEPVIERIFSLVKRYSSRNEAAKAWGINLNTLQNYYKRRQLAPVPRRGLLQKIAEHEGVSLEWLLYGNDSEARVTDVTERTNKNISLGGVDAQLFGLLAILTPQERQALYETLARKGVETVLYLLDEDNIELLRQDPVVKAKILGKPIDSTQEVSFDEQVKRERASDGELQATENDLASTAKKKQAR